MQVSPGEIVLHTLCSIGSSDPMMERGQTSKWCSNLDGCKGRSPHAGNELSACFLDILLLRVMKKGNRKRQGGLCSAYCTLLCSKEIVLRNAVFRHSAWIDKSQARGSMFCK